MYLHAKFHMPTSLVQCFIIYLHHDEIYICTFQAAAILFYIQQQNLDSSCVLPEFYCLTKFQDHLSCEKVMHLANKPEQWDIGTTNGNKNKLSQSM